MDYYFDSGNPVLIFDKFKKFTSESIKSSVKKNTAAPEHIFFGLCDTFQSLYERIIKELDHYLYYLEYCAESS